MMHSIRLAVCPKGELVLEDKGLNNVLFSTQQGRSDKQCSLAFLSDAICKLTLLIIYIHKQDKCKLTVIHGTSWATSS